MLDFFNRQGEPISREEWTHLFWEEEDYRVIAQYRDELALISTVWMGHDPSYIGQQEGRPPKIFETMILSESEGLDEKYLSRYWRWPTEEIAKEGHRVILAAYEANEDPQEAIAKWAYENFKLGR
jgi:hypothetical protein